MESRGDFHRRGASGATALALTALLLALAALLPSGALAASGSISGTVTDANGHAPIAGVVVCAMTVEAGQPAAPAGCERTLADGTYTISSLPNGEYAVLFEGEAVGYFRQYHGGHAGESDFTAVTVANEEPEPGINGELTHGGEIQGTVTAAADGAPVEGVSVCAWTTTGALVRCTFTDAQGHYAVRPLQGGEYKVEFSPGFTAMQELQTQFYLNKATMAEADAVVVVLGAAHAGIDAAMQAVPKPPPALTPPPPVASLPPSVFPITTSPLPVKHVLRCRKGFRKRRIHGKVRCVRVPRHRHRSHHHHLTSRPAAQR